MRENKDVYSRNDIYESGKIRDAGKIQKYITPRKSRFLSGRHLPLAGFLLLGCVLLSGCSAFSRTAGREPDRQSGEAGPVKIGSVLEADAPEQLTLLDNKDTLAADGLYYTTWTAGDSVPYENSDGETIDLYDAQLYLLVSESADAEAAEKDCRVWLASARDNYDIQETEDITCSGQDYTLIVYDCISGDTPYERGVSAFGVRGANAVCAELTCVEDYEGDLTALLKEFLDSCRYIPQ